MKTRLSIVTAAMGAVAATLAAAPALADEALARKSGCLACHAVASRVVGPAFQEVAQRYKGRADSAAHVASKIRQGGAGTWGAIAMPPQPALSDEQIGVLAAWVLAQQPASAK